MSQVSDIRPARNSPLTSACSLGALETLVPGISRSSKSHKLVWDILEFFPLCRSAKAQRQSTKICFSLSRSRQNRVAAWKLQTSQTHVHTCKVPPPFQPSTSCKTTLYHYRTYNKYKQHKLGPRLMSSKETLAIRSHGFNVNLVPSKAKLEALCLRHFFLSRCSSVTAFISLPFGQY